jgi:hypothetical protein
MSGGLVVAEPCCIVLNSLRDSSCVADWVRVRHPCAIQLNGKGLCVNLVTQAAVIAAIDKAVALHASCYCRTDRR